MHELGRSHREIAASLGIANSNGKRVREAGGRGGLHAAVAGGTGRHRWRPPHLPAHPQPHRRFRSRGGASSGVEALRGLDARCVGSQRGRLGLGFGLAVQLLGDPAANSSACRFAPPVAVAVPLGDAPSQANNATSELLAAVALRAASWLTVTTIALKAWISLYGDGPTRIPLQVSETVVQPTGLATSGHHESCGRRTQWHRYDRGRDLNGRVIAQK